MTFTHIDHAVVGKAHPQMYLLHKWWARKPHNIVREYIEAYSKPGDVVLDPFAGSGVTGIEAVRVKRRGLLFDLDPLAVFLAQMTALPVDLTKFEDHARQVATQVQAEIESLYVTKCPDHGTDVPITHVIWADSYECGSCRTRSLRGDRAQRAPVDECPSCGTRLDAGRRVGAEILEIGYSCGPCLAKTGDTKRFVSKTPSPDDVAFVEAIASRPIPAWVPDQPLSYPDGRPFKEKDKTADTVADLFEKRALIALSLLYRAIHRLPKSRERDLLRLCFRATSTLSPE